MTEKQAPVFTAGIAIDNWKYKVFKKRLRERGYEFTCVLNFPTPSCRLLKIKTTDTLKLQKLIEEINSECQRQRSTTH